MQIKTCTSTTLITKANSGIPGVILSMDEKSSTTLSDYLMVFGFPAKRLISIPTYTFNLKQQFLEK